MPVTAALPGPTRPCVWCPEILTFTAGPNEDGSAGPPAWRHPNGMIYAKRSDGTDDHCALPDETR